MRVYQLADDEAPIRREIHPFDSEEQLEEALDELPSLLLDEDILLVGQQVAVGTGTLDLLGLDKYGNVVVFELKKGDSGSGSASEGSILSQPQEYAQALQWLTLDELEGIYEEYRPAEDTAETSNASEKMSLVDVFERRFGAPLSSEGFNQHQRMVIVAEEITDRTGDNARYLSREGLNLQCVEVQRFPLATEDDQSILVSSTVVDYDERRVRPADDAKPVFAELNEAIATRAFPKIKELTHASNLLELFPAGFDHREPRLRSLHPNHPEAVRYALRVKPLEKGHVRLSIDITDRGLDIDDVNKEQLADRVRTAESRFSDAGFEVFDRRNTWRIVSREWPTETAADAGDETLLDEVADAYAELVTIGHEAMTDSN